MLTFSAGGGASSPGSIGELRRQFHSIASYDGLLAHISGHGPVRAYRDPTLLVTGTARLTIRVRVTPDVTIRLSAKGSLARQ